MNSVAIVHKGKPSSWVSCQTITANLRSVYGSALNNRPVSYFCLHDGMDDYQIHRLAREIYNYSPQTISFIDHSPHPHKLLLELRELYQAPLPRVLFHVYGDFTLNAKEWLASEEALVETPVLFVCASERQRDLVTSLLGGQERSKAVHYLPFLVDTSLFTHDPDQGAIFRKHLGLSPQECVFTYTGRLSTQKNVLGLIKVFCSALEFNPHLVLLVAGEMDDIGAPYLGKDRPEGNYFRNWLKVMEELPPQYLKQVRYLGNLSQIELMALYNASDFYISLSTYNDEDFGMSPAEALCCGTPVLLADWGGYASFAPMAGKHCTLLPLTIKQDHIFPRPTNVLKAILRHAGHPLSKIERNHLAERAKSYLSPLTSAPQLKSFFSDVSWPIFSEFGDNMRKLAALYAINPAAPFCGPEGHYVPFYYELYNSYLSKDDACPMPSEKSEFLNSSKRKKENSLVTTKKSPLTPTIE